MGFPERIQALRERVEAEMRPLFLDRQPASLYEPMAYLLEAGGKRIRPILLILSCQAVGGRLERCLAAAVAVELLHTFTLVHDDIMDHDDVRRGRPTVHRRWDEATAILAGDGLVTMAYQSLLRTDHPELIGIVQKFTEGVLVVCEGQALDKEFESREAVSMEDYDGMIEKKTAKLIRVACEMGGILGDGTRAEEEALGRFAVCLGKAFQIQDDLLDILSEEEVLGKPLGSDLVEGKKTYLTIHFLNHAPESERRLFQTLWQKRPMEREAVLQVRDLFDRAGTLEATRQAVGTFIDHALKHLDGLKPGTARDDLGALALMIRERVF